MFAKLVALVVCDFQQVARSIIGGKCVVTSLKQATMQEPCVPGKFRDVVVKHRNKREHSKLIANILLYKLQIHCIANCNFMKFNIVHCHILPQRISNCYILVAVKLQTQDTRLRVLSQRFFACSNV